MDAKQRMADVKQLRNDVCHDFFNLIVQQGWQNDLYQVAFRQVTNNGPFKDAYSNAYAQMRQLDVNNLVNEYKVEDMDVSLMRTIASYWNSKNNCSINYAPMKPNTLDTLRSVKEDRNDGDAHSSGNEDEEELYLQGLLSLVILRQFIKAVDKNEMSIPDPDRLAYYQKYISKINALKDTLDEERIELVQSVKAMDRDIEKIKNSDNPQLLWVQINLANQGRWRIDKGNEETLRLQLYFAARASDAGISCAHLSAASYYEYCEKNYGEAVNRLKMVLESEPELTWQTCKPVIDDINKILIRGYGPTEEMLQLIEYMKNHGHAIEEHNGRYILLEWEKREKERERKRAEEGQKEWKYQSND